MDRAVLEFKRILQQQEYVPALVNLGNIFFLAGEMDKSLEYYERAQSQEPRNPKVLLAIARANHELENYGNVKRAYAELKTLDPQMAQKYAYLDFQGDEGRRAAEISKVRGTVLWDDEEE